MERSFLLRGRGDVITVYHKYLKLQVGYVVTNYAYLFCSIGNLPRGNDNDDAQLKHYNLDVEHLSLFKTLHLQGNTEAKEQGDNISSRLQRRRLRQNSTSSSNSPRTKQQKTVRGQTPSSSGKLL